MFELPEIATLTRQMTACCTVPWQARAAGHSSPALRPISA